MRPRDLLGARRPRHHGGAPRARAVAGRLVTFALALAIVHPGALRAQESDSLERELQRERARLEQMRRDAAAARGEAKKLQGAETRAAGQLRRTERDVRSTRLRLLRLNTRRRSLDQQLDVTRANLQNSIQSLAEARRRLRARLRSMYKFGPAGELEVVLSHQSFAQLLARWDFLQMVAEQDRVLMEDVRTRKEHVEALENRLEGHLSQIQKTTKQTTAESRKLASLRTQRAQQVQTIRTQRQSYEAHAEELERTARQIQRLLANLEARRRAAREQGAQPPAYSGDFARGEGALEWPVSGDLVGRFGQETHPRFGTVINNNGIDIAAVVGTPVRAVARGKVEYTSDDFASYGPIAIIDHGDGYRTLYAHLSEIVVSVGHEVSAGQIIGRVGEAGSLKGPMLHFEVRKGSTPLNPRDWLR